VRITAKVDYGVRAVIELAAADPPTVKGDVLAANQGIPVKYLENILADLRRAGLVASQRGAEGGYRLARPAGEVTVADVIRAVEGPLADVHGTPPEELAYVGPAVPLQRVWIATRAALRSVLEEVTLADIVAERLSPGVEGFLAEPGVWARRPPRAERLG
jgi:Rrf2 family protein